MEMSPEVQKIRANAGDGALFGILYLYTRQNRKRFHRFGGKREDQGTPHKGRITLALSQPFCVPRDGSKLSGLGIVFGRQPGLFLDKHIKQINRYRQKCHGTMLSR